MNVACDARSVAGCDVGSDETSDVAREATLLAKFMAAITSAVFLASDCSDSGAQNPSSCRTVDRSADVFDFSSLRLRCYLQFVG